VTHAVSSFACPECHASLEEQGRSLVCERGHATGRIDGGVPDFRAPRSGVDAELVSFWSSSDDYYETARSQNTDYDDDAHASHRAVIDALGAAGARRILDVGCGTGELAVELARRLGSIDYVGIDVSPEAARQAFALGRPGTYVAADAERLPFADGVFDAAVSLYALEHFMHPRESLRELARVVRPGGLVAVLSLSYDRPHGTIPSRRFGLVWRGRKLARRHPANVLAYAFNRARFALRQAAKQLRYAVDSSYVSFELVRRPLVLDEPYAADTDAVHVVSGQSVLRVLAGAGLELMETSVPAGRLGWLRASPEFRVLARRR
jgi:ubiquinone/menaquinone biosynthesis C-methylase UbiE